MARSHDQREAKGSFDALGAPSAPRHLPAVAAGASSAARRYSACGISPQSEHFIPFCTWNV
jgi:hypothetical protein